MPTDTVAVVVHTMLDIGRYRSWNQAQTAERRCGQPEGEDVSSFVRHLVKDRPVGLSPSADERPPSVKAVEAFVAEATRGEHKT